MSATKFIVMAGPCVIEDEGLTLEIAGELKRQLAGAEIDFYFKASFDKANRTSGDSFRGPGLEHGLKVLERVRSQTGLQLLTDFHEADQAETVARVVDVLQVPAFLCRQTDMIFSGAKACSKYNRILNVKKGQFLAPWDVSNIVEKARSHAGGGSRLPVMISERGASFGYNSLVVDMSAFQCIQRYGVRAIYDATHSIQVPGGAEGGKVTGGKREYLESLARAAVAAGADGVFLECHPNPAVAKSDGPNAFYLDKVGDFVRQLLAIHNVVRELPRLLPEARD